MSEKKPYCLLDFEATVDGEKIGCSLALDKTLVEYSCHDVVREELRVLFEKVAEEIFKRMRSSQSDRDLLIFCVGVADGIAFMVNGESPLAEDSVERALMVVANDNEVKGHKMARLRELLDVAERGIIDVA